MNDLRRVTWIGFWTNIVISCLKLYVGVITSSQALVADGWHSISDCWSDFMLLVASRYWAAPADEDHPHGHRRIEVAVTAAIGVGLAIVASFILVKGLFSIRESNLSQPSPLALAVIVITLLIKEFLYHFTMSHSKRLNSEVLRAYAWHHRSDALSTLPVLIALAISNYDSNWNFLDPIAALLVVVFLYKTSYEIAFPAIQKLVDQGAPPQIIQNIKNEVMQLSDVKGVSSIRTRYVGNLELSVEVDIEVDGSLSVWQSHEIANTTRDILKNKIEFVVDVVVRVDPWSPKKKHKELV